MNRMLVPAFLIAFSALAQQKAPYGETLEVRVIDVDVVVTDRSGKPVTGLTRDDFELFENGKRKEITNFLEINERAGAGAASGGTAATPAERRHLIVFLDNTSMQRFNRNRVLASMKTFIETTMRTNDEAMVVSWNPGLKEDVALTTDRARVLAALQTMATTSAGGAMLRASAEVLRHAALAQFTLEIVLVLRLPHEPFGDFRVVLVDLAERRDPVVDALVREVGQHVTRRAARMRRRMRFRRRRRCDQQQRDCQSVAHAGRRAAGVPARRAVLH